MKSSNSWMNSGLVLALETVCIVFALNAAQVETTKSIQPGQSSEVVRVDRGEVLALQGNDLIVRMEDGSVRHFENIPESAKATVDGKQLGIHDLKPGMKLQRTITTTTTPHTVTTILTVTGKVWHVTPPLSVILTLENGTNQSFKIPKDQKFNVNGEMVDAFGLKKGMVVRAIKIVEEAPMTTTTEQKSVTGTMPTPPPTLPADTPLLIAESAPTAAPTETTEAPAGAATKGAPASPCAYGSACCCHHGSARCPCENESDDGRLSPTYRSGNTWADHCFGFGRSKIRSWEVARLGWFEKEEPSNLEAPPASLCFEDEELRRASLGF